MSPVLMNPFGKTLGKVRHVGVAGETPYGVTRYCEHAIWDGLPKIACVQQEYNILTQNKVEMGESCHVFRLLTFRRLRWPTWRDVFSSSNKHVLASDGRVGCSKLLTPYPAPSSTPCHAVALSNCGGGADLVEACAPRQENVAIVATQTLGGGALSTKYMFERNKWDRVSFIGVNLAVVHPPPHLPLSQNTPDDDLVHFRCL